MNKKNILILILLITPVLMMAQFKVDLSLNPGITKTTSDGFSGPGDNKLGFSFQGGFDANYMFSEKVGIGTGVYYTYSESKWKYPVSMDQSSNAISIPLNLIYRFNSSIIEMLLGAVVNISLNEKVASSSGSKYEYKSFYTSLKLGCFYKFNDKLKLGIIADAGISPYFEITPVNAVPEYAAPVEKLLLQSLGIRINYTLFGK